MKDGIQVAYIGYYCKLALQFLLFCQWRETRTSKSLKALKVQDTWYEETWEYLQWLDITTQGLACKLRLDSWVEAGEVGVLHVSTKCLSQN